MAQAVAEHAVSMLLCLQKKLLVSDAAIRTGRYSERDSLRGAEMMGKTLGLIGLGKTGKIVAHIAGQGFAAKVIGYDPYVPTSMHIDGVEIKGSFEEVIREADMVSIHVPLTKETKNLFNTQTLSQMKKGSLIVNVSRGGIVNEDDLYDMLKMGHIGGAGLDVFVSEPPNHQHLLFSLPNVVVTPHNAGMTDESVIRMSTMLASDVIRALNGEMPQNPVNPGVWGK
jgi:D-3-phosphoglycerate dehydrogenase